MKKTIKIAAISLFAASIFASGCSKDETVPDASASDPQLINISLSADADAGTRTIIEGNKTAGFTAAWHTGDKLGLYTHYDNIYYDDRTDNAEFVIASIDGKTATFDGKIVHDGTKRTYEIYAYTPRNPNVESGNHTSVEYLTVQAKQTMTANDSHDHNNDFMVALPGQKITVSENGTITATELADMKFRYIVGFINLSIKSIEVDGVSADEAVESIVIKASGGPEDTVPAIAGNFNLDLTTGEKKFPFGLSNEIRVWLPDTESTEAVTLGELCAWACVMPFEAEELTFQIVTEKNRIEKKVTTATLGNSFSIGEGDIKTFNMTIDDQCTIEENKPVNLILANSGVIQKGYYGDLYNVSLTFRSYDPSGYWEGIAITQQTLAAMKDDSSIEYMDLPNGTYTFDNSLADKTITLGEFDTYISCYENDKYKGKYTVTGGTMVVAGDHTHYDISFEIQTAEAGTIRAEYHGALNIPNPNYLPPAQTIDIGELTGAILMEYKSNPYGAPYNVDTWYLALGGTGTFLEYGAYKGTGWILQTFLYAPMVNAGAPMPDGTYEIRSSYDPYSGVPGEWSRPARTSWIMKFENSVLIREYELPIVSGTVTSHFKDGIYEMQIDLTTINGDIVTGTAKIDPTVVPQP